MPIHMDSSEGSSLPGNHGATIAGALLAERDAPANCDKVW